MELIPVIDLLGGRAVRAIRGERSRYQPLSSPLCASQQAAEVAHAYLALYPFGRIYLADLDAILGCGDNTAAIARLRAQLPQVELWLDAGIRTLAQLHRVEALGCRAVIGSEVLKRMDDYYALLAAAAHEPLLSLDFNAGGFLGPTGLLLEPNSWPSQVILMTLDRVGSQSGPDFAQLARIRTLTGASLYAAGGVRDAADIEQLKADLVDGALIASALHAGRIDAVQIAMLQA